MSDRRLIGQPTIPDLGYTAGSLNFHCCCKLKCSSSLSPPSPPSKKHTHTKSGTFTSTKSVWVNKTSQTSSSCDSERVAHQLQSFSVQTRHDGCISQPAAKCVSHYVAPYVTKYAFFKRSSPQPTAKRSLRLP